MKEKVGEKASSRRDEVLRVRTPARREGLFLLRKKDQIEV